MQRTLSMRRLAAVTGIVFVLVLAFLAGRVRAGADPTQSAAPAASTAQPQTQSTPAYPDGNTYGAPGDTVVPGDSPGFAVPGDGGQSAPGGGQVAPDGDPPMTHAS